MSDTITSAGITGGCLPQSGNYLELVDEIDQNVRKARIHFCSGPNEDNLRRHAMKLTTMMWERVGATDVWSLER